MRNFTDAALGLFGIVIALLCAASVGVVCFIILHFVKKFW